ncbi:hypothetical protein BFJ68_g17897 [Fusarium oxysporum]|uniref:Uncharacterized protein n=2 Tax=Fusarium oxysporum TaxID=5507 RepID=A0A420NDS6_FUSOX|nr:hypothetical protein FOZG_17555 [Fusarium oxysporum Fo47]RKK78391.1 hypothetical protein BFJ68_g17897 [Fusarium oxysporum]
MTDLLIEKIDGFMIDIELLESVRESIRKAWFATKPLNAADISTVPQMDDIVTFHLT